MSDFNFFKKDDKVVNTLSARFDEAEMEFVNENYEEITGSQERITFKDFLIRAVTKAVNKVNNSPSRKQDTERIKELEIQNEKLTKSIEDLNSDPVIEEKEVTVYREKELSENDCLITFSAYQKHLITETCKKLSERYKKEITPGQLLPIMFTSYVEEGPQDFFPLPFKSSELRTIKEQFK